MIEIAGDFHTHTTHSHGKGSVEDNVQAAIDRGLKAIAISDHGISHRFFNIRNAQKYLDDIENIRSKYAGRIGVYCGYEGNLQSLDGALDLPDELLSRLDFPFFGYHKMVHYPRPKDFMHFMLPKSTSSSAVGANTDACIRALERYPVMQVAHPGYGLPIDKRKLARAAAARGAALEINAKHPEFTVEELRECAEEGVAFMIGSDAHSPGRVGDFRAAIERAEQAGIPPARILNSEQNIDALLEALEEKRRKRGPEPFREILGRVYEAK